MVMDLKNRPRENMSDEKSLEAYLIESANKSFI